MASIRRVVRASWTIAKMTILEARRNRITWSLVFFAAILVLNSFLMQEVTIHAFDRILRDVALATIHVFGLLFSIFLGVTAVTREIERRTVCLLLAKPLGRGQYLFGKLLGIWLTIGASLGMMLGVFLLENLLFSAPVRLVLFQTFWLMLVECLVITSFAILASTFTSSYLSVFLAVSLFAIGHLSSDLQYFGRKSGSPVLHALGRALYFVLPDLEKLNLKTPASLLSEVSAGTVAQATGYGLLYAAMFFALSLAIFSRRDLK